MQHIEELATQLDRLAALEPGPFPFISLYLNLQPDDRGRDRFEPFLRRELANRLRTYGSSAPERESLRADTEKIRAYVEGVSPAVNGLAIFACSGANVFEAAQLAAPIEEHRLYISDEPHLYPLAKILDAYPRYLALLADTQSARIFVFAANVLEQKRHIQGTRTKHHKQGGWSQARYQRHVENFHAQLAKEVSDHVARIVREEGIDKIVVSGDEVVLPRLREHLPKDVAGRIIDVVRLGTHAPEHEILQATIARLREKDAATDRERVDELLGAYRADRLACVGVEETLRAFELGRVDELLLTADADALDVGAGRPLPTEGAAQTPTAEERAADTLVAQARRTAANVRFIEDASLLEAVGGVGAFLRF